MDQTHLTKDKEFVSSLIVFQVESCLFSIPRKRFVDDSNVFRDMFELPKAKDAVCDGADEEHPLHLDGIKSDEFRAFLKALYMPKYHYLSEQDLSAEEWLSVMKLARMWEFEELWEQAEKSLDCSIDAICRIQLARKYEISDWIHQAFSELVEREDALTDEEVEKFGLRDALQITRIRERKQAQLIKHYNSGRSRKRRCGRGHEEEIPRRYMDCPHQGPSWSESDESYEKRKMREVIDDGCNRITFTVV